MSEGSHKRAVPVQERSRRRYEAVMDAAAHAFAERGFHATTMQEIAEAAQTSIGSVYRFFPDKQSVFRAMIDRLVGREEEILARLMSGAFTRSWPELIDATIDAYVELQQTEPGWRAVWMNLYLYRELGEASHELEAQQLARIEQILAFYGPSFEPSRRAVIAATVHNYLAGMLLLYGRHPEDRHEALLEETRRMLRCYAEALLDEAGRA